jgi:anti-anti-sigma regulatory factor
MSFTASWTLSTSDIKYEEMPDNTVCLKFIGEFTMEEIPLFSKIKSALPNHQELVIDLSQTTRVDSTGFGVFILVTIQLCSSEFKMFCIKAGNLLLNRISNASIAARPFLPHVTT